MAEKGNAPVTLTDIQKMLASLLVRVENMETTVNENAQLPPNNPQPPQPPPYVPVPPLEHVQQPPPDAMPFVLALQVNQGVPIQPVAFDHNVTIPNPVAPSPVVDSRGGARIFCLGWPNFVTNILVSSQDKPSHSGINAHT